MADVPPTPDQVPGLEHVADAWRRVQRVRGSGVHEFKVGICDRQEQLVSCVQLDSFDQVKSFGSRLAELGYSATIPSTDEIDGCDVIFMPKAAVRDLLDP